MVAEEPKGEVIMERIIRVTGNRKLSVKPDLIQLFLTLENKGEEYAETARQATEYVEELKQCFEELGFERADLKTRSYSIDTEYERERKQRLVVSRHSLKIEFDADNNRLGQILYALAHTSVKPEFWIEYTVKDKEGAKKLLLSKAVADSKEKAQVLVTAAGVKLGDVATIDCSWDDIAMVSRPLCGEVFAMNDIDSTVESYKMSIEPEDITISDSVTVVWMIE